VRFSKNKVFFKRLFGALRSCNRAAYLGIALTATAPATRLVDKLLGLFLTSDKAYDGKMPPCVFIVCAPRSGGTIVYQVLARVIPSVYLSNLHALFPRFASSFMFKRNLFGRNLSNGSNYYGHTPQLYDVNESNNFLEAIFKDDAGTDMIRARFSNMLRKMNCSPDRPFIIKNVRVGYQSIQKLHDAIPEFRFIRVRRNIEHVIRSELRAHYELGTFHPIPLALENCDMKDPVSFATFQISEIEKIIDSQLKQVDPSAWVEWRYEDFCVNAKEMIESFVKTHLSLSGASLRDDAILDSLDPSAGGKVSRQDGEHISALLEQLKTPDTKSK